MPVAPSRVACPLADQTKPSFPACSPTAEQREGGSGGVPTQHEAHQECSCTAHVWVVPANLQWCADVVGVAQMATTVSKAHHSARSDKKVRKLLFQICTGNCTALYPIRQCQLG